MTARRIEEAETPDLAARSEREKELAIAFQRGEQAAYLTIYRDYAGKVSNICRHMLGHPHDAEEACQETFLKVYEGLSRFNGRYQLGSWITRIATNVCLDHLRARSRRPSDGGPVEALRPEPEGPVDENPEVALIRTVSRAEVRGILELQTPMHRAAIVLRDLEGLSYREIAEVLEMTEPQVKALIHRARRSFRRTWSARLSSLLILPVGLLQRLRRLEGPLKERISAAGNAADSFAGAATSSVQTASVQAATTCSAAIQQCGQFFAERTVAVAAAAALTTTAAVASVGATDTRPAAVQGRVERQVEAATASRSGVPATTLAVLDEKATSAGVTPKPDTADKPAAVPSPGPTHIPGSAGEGIAAQATPLPTPTTAPSPGQGAHGSQQGGGQVVGPDPGGAPAEPAGFTFDFFVRAPAVAEACTCVTPLHVDSESVEAGDWGITRLDQSLRGGAATIGSGGSPMYGLAMHQFFSLGAQTLDFSLFTNRGFYRYSANGAPVSRTQTAWGGWSYRFAGSFELQYRSNSESVPQRGSYVAVIVVSTKTDRVVSGSFELEPAAQ